ncbi:MAG TPA: CPBP family glutamic-type intramembrane protease [Acidimicrobiia bacterium]|nr:CPBP family glutamic-type intramembrane protease [Acidimicrobiia bacterium]
MPAGWYPDPWQIAHSRFWDGHAWTAHMSGAYTPVYAPPVRESLADIEGGGGVALLAFAGAFALAIICESIALAAGVSRTSVIVDVVGHIGLWGGLFMGAYIVTHRRAGGTLRDLGLAWPTGKEIGTGFGFAFLALFAASRVIEFLQALLPHDDTGIRSNVFVQHQPSATTILITAVIVCVGAPFFEELFFRGLVQSILTRRYGFAAAICIQAVLFGSAHYQLGMTLREATVRVTAVGIIGLFLGFLRHRTGRLGAGMVAHATNNAIVVLVAIALMNSH